MNKLIHTKKNGFTLVELMIVIAVIGILAVVLIPKMASVKDSAKNAGVEVNMRSVRAILETMIDTPYTSTLTLRDDIIAKIGNSIKNPYNGGTSCIALSGTLNNAAVVVYEGTPALPADPRDYFDVQNTSDSPTFWTRTDCKGTVLIFCYWRNSNIEISIYGYNNLGKPIIQTAKVPRVNTN